MMYRRIDRLTPHNFSNLLCLCYENTGFNGCVACDSAESAEKLTDEMMRNFNQTSIPGLREVEWNMQNKCGRLTFFNGSRILITPMSEKYEDRLEGINKLLYQGEPSEDFMSCARRKITHKDLKVSDIFRAPADRQDDEIATDALDEFLNSFKTIAEPVATKQQKI